MTTHNQIETNDEATLTEPGRTMGSAEGERTDTPPVDPRREPGRTPGQAEGDRATVEADLQRQTDVAAPQSAAPAPETTPFSSDQTAGRQEYSTYEWGGHERRVLDELLHWGALVGGSGLALYGLSRSFGNLSLIALGGGLVYYALKRSAR
jgi:hypothetical protein